MKYVQDRPDCRLGTLLFQITNLDNALVRDCLLANVIGTLAQHEPSHRRLLQKVIIICGLIYLTSLVLIPQPLGLRFLSSISNHCTPDHKFTSSGPRRTHPRLAKGGTSEVGSRVDHY